LLTSPGSHAGRAFEARRYAGEVTVSIVAYVEWEKATLEDMVNDDR
jgi:hypothetical protein